MDAVFPIHHTLHFPWLDSSVFFQKESGQTGLYWCCNVSSSLGTWRSYTPRAKPQQKSLRVPKPCLRKTETSRRSILSCIHPSCSSTSRLIAQMQAIKYHIRSEHSVSTAGVPDTMQIHRQCRHAYHLYTASRGSRSLDVHIRSRFIGLWLCAPHGKNQWIFCWID